ncbi:MAG: type I glutamate--ammonia ligase [Planctomycetes bacterium]|nr:type I glutamate--ammonia ligase [Planctomycetota bacterium]
MKSPQEVLGLIREKNVVMVDLRFTDFLGRWHHFSVPSHFLRLEEFEEGLGFDGSSLRGWQAINESDMLVFPDPKTAFLDPFTEHPTLILICDIRDPISGASYNKDPRTIAQKAVNYLKSTGIGDVAYFGPEAEFFVFDDVRFAQNAHEGYYHLDSVEGCWNTGRVEQGGNLSYKPRHKEGYFPTQPTDTLQDLRSEMSIELENAGIEVERQHHEVATAGQCEIDIKYDSLVAMADKLMKFKYIVRNVAHRRGKVVTFMPKPLYGDNGSGMHTHFSIWKNGKNNFFGDKYAGFSQEGLYAIGGVLQKAHALIALSNPSTNSYKRLVPGYEAPVRLAYSSRNRSAAIRIPMYSNSEGAKRFEFRTPDSTSNPYIFFAALTMAAIHGIKNKVDPGTPLDKDIYGLSPEELKDVPSTPRSFEDALDALEHDHSWLLHGDVFTKEVIETWIQYKRIHEVDAVKLRPHPHEFELYIDA